MNTALLRKIRINRTSVSATALAAAVLAGVLAPSAFAATPAAAATPPAATAAQVQTAKTLDAKGANTASTIDESLLRFSTDGQRAIDSVRLARIDLFDVKPDLAKQDLQAARKALMVAKADAPSFVSSTQVQVGGKTIGTEKDQVKADIVPIDGSLVVADEYLAKPKNQGFLAKARSFLHMGDKASAVKTLKEGEIDVSYQRKWLVIPDAVRQLDQADAAMAKGDYYQANVALKALEDGVQVDTVSFAPPVTKPAS